MAALMGWAFLFAPTGAFTLEANVIFSTYALALAYARTNPTAVVGKVISVDSGEEKGVYMIEAIGADGSLKKVGSDIDLSNYVTKDLLTSIYTYKGTVEDYDALIAIENPAIGDVYNVESDVVINKELNSETYLSGTNWVWNGESWDALAGAIDLSGYALKSEVESLNESTAQSIAELSGDILAINNSLGQKVNAEKNHSLISAEKLALIDTNATDIQALRLAIGLNPDGTPGEDASLETRVGAAEASISALQSDNTTNKSNITALLSDNATNKTNIDNLQASVNDHESRIVGVVAANAELTTNISKLSTDVSTLETGVSGLRSTTDLHTNEIANISSNVNGVIEQVTKIKADYLKAADISGKLDASVYEAKISELELADSTNLQEAKNYADGLKVTIDAAYALADAKTLQDAKDYADSLVYDDAALEARVKANEDALLVLNGADTVDGSVANQVNAAINKFASDVTNNETIDTFKELVDYAASHNSEYATLAGTVLSNTTALEVLNGDGAGSVAKAVKNAVDAEAAIARAAEEANANAIKAISDDYLKAEHKTALEGLITAEANRAKGVENAIDARLLVVEGDYLKAADKSALQLSIDSKVDQSAYDTKIAELEQADADTLQAAKDYTDAAFEWIDVK